MMMYATASCRRRLERITSPAALTLLSISLSLHQRSDCCSEMRRLLMLLLAPPRSTIDDVSPLTYKPAAVTAPRSPEGCNTARGAACVPALHAGAARRPAGSLCRPHITRDDQLALDTDRRRYREHRRRDTVHRR